MRSHLRGALAAWTTPSDSILADLHGGGISSRKVRLDRRQRGAAASHHLAVFKEPKRRQRLPWSWYQKPKKGAWYSICWPWRQEAN